MIPKSSHNKILTFLIYFILLGYCKFFYIIPLKGTVFTDIPANILLSATIAVLSFMILIAMEGKKIILGEYAKEIGGLFLILAVNSISMLATYHYPILKILWADIIFLVLLGYFPLVAYIKKNSLSQLISIIESITIILALILLLQFFVYRATHIVFLSLDLHSLSFDRFRGPGDGLIRISVILSAYKIIKEKNGDFRSILNFILGLAVVIILDRSRMYLLAIMLTIYAMVLILYRKNLMAKKSIMIIVFAVTSLLILGYLYFSLRKTLMNAHDGSNYARRGAIVYYFQTLSKHWWTWFTGLGIVEPKPGDSRYFLIHGPQGIYYYADIGIFGTLASMGILGFLWVIWITIKGFLIASYRNDFKALYYGLMIEMTFSWLTSMSYFNDIRLIGLTLILSIMGVKSKEVKSWTLPI